MKPAWPLDLRKRVPPGPPRPIRWTTDQFHHLGDLGVFEGRRAMLLDGVVLEEGQESPAHCCARGLVADFFYRAFPGCYLTQRTPLVLGSATALDPDIAVVSGNPRDYIAAHPTTAVFVTEVADFSVLFDTTTKAGLYATAGVADYWVVDVDGRQLFVFRDPVPLPAGLGTTAYRTRRTFGPADSVAPLAAPNSPVKVADLLP
ncbi:MAG: Uma2 family endonuclease [Gemmataceae bacterium]|nr:Uma2 family endonuclease [Gemmataceae bacterium]